MMKKKALNVIFHHLFTNYGYNELIAIKKLGNKETSVKKSGNKEIRK